MMESLNNWSRAYAAEAVDCNAEVPTWKAEDISSKLSNLSINELLSLGHNQRGLLIGLTARKTKF